MKPSINAQILSGVLGGFPDLLGAGTSYSSPFLLPLRPSKFENTGMLRTPSESYGISYIIWGGTQ